MPDQSENSKVIFDFYRSHLSKVEDEMTVVLKVHLFSEGIIDNLLSTILPFPDKIICMRYSQKIDVVESLNYLPKYLVSKLRKLNSLRNSFAHDLNYVLSDQDCRDIGFKYPIEDKSQKMELIIWIFSLLLSYLRGWIFGHNSIPQKRQEPNSDLEKLINDFVKNFPGKQATNESKG